MKIEDLINRVDEKNKKIADIKGKISSFELSISEKEAEIQNCVSSGNPDEAIAQTKIIRDLQDEVAIYKKVLDEIRQAPAFSMVDVEKVWAEVIEGERAEMVQLVNELAESSERYNAAINAVISKYDDVRTLRDKVEMLSTRESLAVRLKKGVTTDIDMEQYVPDREI